EKTGTAPDSARCGIEADALTRGRLSSAKNSLIGRDAMATIAPWRRRRGGADQLEKKLSSLQSDLARLQEDLRGLASAGGAIAGETVSDAFDSAQAGARAAAGRAVEQLESWTNGNLEPVRH